ncbi:TonB-dependent receptor [Pseudoalteromonas mariniglutinosa]|uniref:TonB-dependent receptor n=1 Tax=Pseudoalteromonas mariniglutinosa TaxID=206042 RepID=UPI00384E0D84
MHTITKINAITLGLLMASSGFNHALADEQAKELEVIMVTAQKRAQSVKEVPLSITAISGAQLQGNNINDTEELSSHIANFDVSQSGQGYNITMRGLGSGPNQGFEQTVGTYVDGVYRGRAYQMRSAFVDLARFEVLRGPQSTLFGKNTTAGALNITTAAPTEELSGYAQLSYEIDNGTTFDGALSTGITDNLQVRGAVKVIDQDGYFYNTLAERDEVGRDGVFSRLTLTWQPTDNLDISLKYQRDQEDNIGITASQPVAEPVLYDAPLPGVYGDISQYVVNDKLYKGVTALGEDEQGEFSADYWTLNVQWDLGEHVVSSVTGWQDYTMLQSNDGDHGPAPLTYRQASDESFQQFSQELRISSYYDGPFNFIAGLYYQTTELDFTEQYRIYPLNALGPRRYDSDSDTQAVFAKLDYQFAPKWQASLGLRYSNEQKQASRSLGMIELSSGTAIDDLSVVNVPATLQGMGFPAMLPTPIYLQLLSSQLGLEQHQVSGERDENEFNPSLNITRQFEDAMIYASVSTGSKAGGFDARANLAKDWQFEPEKVTAYEVGTKLTLADGAADLNIALFTMQFEDLQTSTFDGVAGFYVENGAQSSSRGVEIDGRWLLTDNWQLSGNVAYLDFSWDEFKGAKCFTSAMFTPNHVEPSGVTCDLSGATGAYAPKWSGSVNLDYTKELTAAMELTFNIESVFKASYYTNYDLNPFTEQSGYGKINMRLGLMNYDNGWSLALLGKNLSDKYTSSYSTDMSFSPAGMYAMWVEPGRTVALQVGYRF